MTDIKVLAERLDSAAHTAKAVAQLGSVLSLDEAYAVQAASLDRRFSRGERRIGIKMGFTSRAKMVQMGVDEMIFGRLTDQMMVEDGGHISIADYVHPRAEPEIAFLIGKRIDSPVTALTAMAHIEAAAPAIEIIDSRYEAFKFSLTDVVADNSSSSGFVVGAWDKAGLDLSNLGMILSVDGRPVQIGSTAAILGHPIRALVAASRLVTQRGETLEPGDLVLAGAATAAQALQPGSYIELKAQNLGRAGFHVGE